MFTAAHGERRTCTIIRDVTARLSTERELLDARSRLAGAERIAQMGTWEWEPPRELRDVV